MPNFGAVSTRSVSSTGAGRRRGALERGAHDVLGVGIVGAGDFGAAHAQAIAGVDDVEVRAASRTDEAASSVRLTWASR